ncbi:hypothetical protein [Roseovarius litorisediminis]|nr:hypothetical protein [Roseovarius litorisediminis]
MKLRAELLTHAEGRMKMDKAREIYGHCLCGAAPVWATVTDPIVLSATQDWRPHMSGFKAV